MVEIVFREEDILSGNIKGIGDTILDFYRRYDEALMSLSVPKMNKFLKAQGSPGIPNNEAGMLAIHMARATSGRIPSKARAYSVRWLKARIKPTPLLDDVMCKEFYVHDSPSATYLDRHGGISTTGGHGLPQRCELTAGHKGKHLCTQRGEFFAYKVEW